MTFRERYMAGEAEFDEIFSLTDEWNFSEEACTLREYLGLTPQEEDIWISESDEALEQWMEQEKKRKILFTDLDDTLLDSRKQITPATRKALKAILQAKDLVAFSTGRAFPSALWQAERLGLPKEGCYIISYNGGHVYDISARKTLFSVSIPPELIRRCASCALRFGIHIQAYSDTSVIVHQDNEHVRAYCRIQDLPYQVVDDIAAALPKGTPKLLALDIHDQRRVIAFRKVLQQEAGDALDLFMSSSCYLEIVPKGVNKGNALRFLCQYLGIPISRSVAVGDQENDIPMIEAAGVGCAMRNASDPVKAKADYVTRADQDHDGVAELLEKFFLRGDP